jgi:hypothetical protein
MQITQIGYVDSLRKASNSFATQKYNSILSPSILKEEGGAGNKTHAHVREWD